MSVNGVHKGSTERRNNGNRHPVKCASCKGSGVVARLSEITAFEDRRCCSECEAGRALASRIREIIVRLAP